MSEYTELCRELRNTERICRDRMDGEVMLKAADAIEELEKKMLNWQATADDHWEAYQHWFHKYMDDMPKWIPVTERLPEKTGTYLAWMKWDLTEADEEPSAYPVGYDADAEGFGWWESYYDAETLGWAGEDFVRYEGITHWMPLPEPPKEET